MNNDMHQRKTSKKVTVAAYAVWCGIVYSWGVIAHVFPNPLHLLGH